MEKYKIYIFKRINVEYFFQDCGEISMLQSTTTTKMLNCFHGIKKKKKKKDVSYTINFYYSRFKKNTF